GRQIAQSHTRHPWVSEPYDRFGRPKKKVGIAHFAAPVRDRDDRRQGPPSSALALVTVVAVMATLTATSDTKPTRRALSTAARYPVGLTGQSDRDF
ncbi:hypothetical protein, partial [Streptosporangium sp. NPDC052375]|uniref:hypothetical protein n=1 Tax=Streptosporangium sp. NPDC052375 TaxID=3366195 RepID=UPI0037D464EE